MPATSRDFTCYACSESFVVSAIKVNDGKRYCRACFQYIFIECRECGEIIDRRHTRQNGSHRYCEDCYVELFISCDGCGSEIELRRAHNYVSPVSNPNDEDEDEAEILARTSHYCGRCYARSFQRCASCDTLHPTNVMQRNPYEDYFCPECYESQCTHCSECASMIWQRDARWHGDDPRCSQCSIQTDEWDQQEFKCPEPTYDRVGTKRLFGVEIETARCDSHWELCGETIWGCEYDCSVSGKEFISPPMFGDQGLDSIAEFCHEAQNRGWRTDDRCGLHLHFDMCDMEDVQLFSLAYAYRLSWVFWKRFVSPRRGGYDMCGSPRYTLDDIRDAKCWEYFVGARDRFEYVNWRSYFKHGTFEIRLGEPTLDGDEIINWVTTHAMFIEHVKDLTFDQLDAAFGDGSSPTRAFSFSANYVWRERPDIIEYLRTLSQRHHDRGIQIRGQRHYPEHEIFRDA